MTVLRDCAEKLASKPPIALYEQLMKLITDEQITRLQETLRFALQGSKQRELIEESIAACRSAARQYQNNTDRYGQDVADFSVTAICDFAAMCMMVIAAGTERVEALKKALLGQQRSFSHERDNGDRAYLFMRGEAKKLRQTMDEWLSRDSKSIVQFKFPAGGDLHTFAAEKFTHALGVEPYFYLYQAYQNTYSLSHFLGLTPAAKDPVLKKFYQKVFWEPGSAIFKRSYNNDFDTYVARVLRERLEAIDVTAEVLGRGDRGLDQELFRTAVIESLAIMLDGQLEGERYAALTGSHTTSKIESGYMMVLICDNLDHKVCAANLESLYEPPANVTKYLECGVEV